jgi:hypothetical protein
MYCGSCLTLCDKVEFDITHKPTSLNKLVEIQLGREYSEYIPNEIKKLSKQEKNGQEDLWTSIQNE